MEGIRFYSSHGKHGFLSNFYRAQIKVEGYIWPTSEHYYQAQKFNDPSMTLSDIPVDVQQSIGKMRAIKPQEFERCQYPSDLLMALIRCQDTPKQAAFLARRTDLPLRKDWEQVKDYCMLIALRAKFTEHPDLKQQLLDTGDAALIENSPKDSYWGVGPDGKGKNKLGVLLVLTRSQISRGLVPFK